MPRKSLKTSSKQTKLRVIDKASSLICEEIASFSGQKRKSDCFQLPEDMDPNNNQKRHCPMQVQTSWAPLTYQPPITPEPMDEIDGGRMFRCPQFMNYDSFRGRNDLIGVSFPRPSPLPKLDWTESRELWASVLRKEVMHVRNADMLQLHSEIQPRMRSILLDWLIEVSEVYRLHRETYYLALDFIDRYLAVELDVQKHKLQLIGITALFIAAKAEEIYPPKLSEFAYVTDGACSEEEILDLELVILKALKWDLTPVTPNAWLCLFLQLVTTHVYEGEMVSEFHLPRYSASSFIQIIRLLDLVTLDYGSLRFPYSVLTTSAVYQLAAEPRDALTISGYEYADIASCVEWMTPFTRTVGEAGLVEARQFTNIPQWDAHNIQTHVVDTELLEVAQTRQQQFLRSSAITSVLQDIGNRSSPEVNKLGVLTPPQSVKKHDVAS